jgi:hypothetical protein
MKKNKSQVKFSNAMAKELIKLIDDPAMLAQSINCHVRRIGGIHKVNTWGYHLHRLANWIFNGMHANALPFKVFNLSGNTKLDFAAFSSLPFVDCPGKGACQQWCYSVKAWRYPAAFCRQIQNSLLIRNQFSVIENHYKSLPKVGAVRLYVDGDFPSVDVLRQWMDLIKLRPDLEPYGYSKSWIEFLQLDSTGYEWPENYTLNISGGSKFADNSGIKNAMTKIAVVRGGYDAVPVDEKFIKNGAYHSKDHPDSFEYRAQVRKELKKLSKKVFACPGTCSNCLPNGEHACGSKKMKGVLIGSGIHSKVA